MLGQVVCVEAAHVEALDLVEALPVDPVQTQARHRLDVVEHPELQRHGITSRRSRCRTLYQIGERLDAATSRALSSDARAGPDAVASDGRLSSTRIGGRWHR